MTADERAVRAVRSAFGTESGWEHVTALVAHAIREAVGAERSRCARAVAGLAEQGAYLVEDLIRNAAMESAVGAIEGLVADRRERDAGPAVAATAPKTEAFGLRDEIDAAHGGVTISMDFGRLTHRVHSLAQDPPNPPHPELTDDEDDDEPDDPTPLHVPGE